MSGVHEKEWMNGWMKALRTAKSKVLLHLQKVTKILWYYGITMVFDTNYTTSNSAIKEVCNYYHLQYHFVSVIMVV